MLLVTCHATTCLQHTGIFLTECGKPFSCLFLFYKENQYSTPVGASWLMIRVFIPSLDFYSEGPSLCVFILPQELDLTLLTLHWRTIFSLLERKRGIFPTNWCMDKPLNTVPVLISVNSDSRLLSLHQSYGCVSVSCSVLFFIKPLNHIVSL